MVGLNDFLGDLSPQLMLGAATGHSCIVVWLDTDSLLLNLYVYHLTAW